MKVCCNNLNQDDSRNTKVVLQDFSYKTTLVFLESSWFKLLQHTFTEVYGVYYNPRMLNYTNKHIEFAQSTLPLIATNLYWI